MVTVSLPTDTSEDLAAATELQDALSAAQIKFSVSEKPDEVVLSYDDSVAEQVYDAMNALGLDVDEDKSEDDWGGGDDIYRTEDATVLDLIDQVLEGADPADVYNDFISEGVTANPVEGGKPEVGLAEIWYEDDAYMLIQHDNTFELSGKVTGFKKTDKMQQCRITDVKKKGSNFSIVVK